MTESEIVPDAFTVRPLAPATWDAFADLAERHNGVWGRLLVHVVPHDA